MSNKTINSTSLRHNLDDVFDQVANGQQVTVTHRFKSPVIISSKKAMNGLATDVHVPLSGLKEFEKADKKPSPFNPQTPVKKLYKQHLQENYGQ